ncbi:MAG: hypothetical protein ACREL5_14535 [Gemmatimonadales bacterium]
MPDDKPLRNELTPEQQTQARRLSGTDTEAIEISPKDAPKGGGFFRFLSRLSVSTGIPRFRIDEDEDQAS